MLSAVVEERASVDGLATAHAPIVSPRAAATPPRARLRFDAGGASSNGAASLCVVEASRS